MNNINLKITNTDKHIQNPDGKSLQEKMKLADAAKKFESLLTTFMLKSMNKTTKGLFGGEGFGGDYFDSLFEMEIANKMSEQKGLGIADKIYSKVFGEKLNYRVLKSELLNETNKNYTAVKKNKSESGITPENLKLVPSNSALNRLKNFDAIISKASEEYNIKPEVIKSIILTESNGNHDAVSHVGAKGLMQLMDTTAADMGVNDVFNPVQNIFGGTKYFSDLLKNYDDDLELSLAAYNAGPGNVAKYKGIPPFAETQQYVSKVMGYFEYFKE